MSAAYHQLQRPENRARIASASGRLTADRDVPRLGRPPREAAALASALQALLDAGLIRRVRAGGESRFKLTELGQSTPTEE